MTKSSDTIDNEWAKFVSSGYNDDVITDDDDNDNDEINDFIQKDEEIVSSDVSMIFNSTTPKATEIYISTKTKIAYLNQIIDLKEVFWKIGVLPYATPENGVIKKQIKMNSTTCEELADIQTRLLNENYFEQHIITNIDNPNGRIKFKDIRKITIGLSKKDLMSYRCKKKSAFYNCFVLIFRINIDGLFKEFHVKVFNTGKLELPGIQSESSFKKILQIVIDTLQPHVSSVLEYKENTCETVLINSNFNCGFFINREVFNDILKYKYNIQAIYDPCSYPGIQCKFYYNPDVSFQTGSQISEENRKVYENIYKVSFMIFRTGSVLIVGKCDEDVLFSIYEFLKIILNNEYKNICQKNINSSGEEIHPNMATKCKKKKIRRKTIICNV